LHLSKNNTYIANLYGRASSPTTGGLASSTSHV